MANGGIDIKYDSVEAGAKQLDEIAEKVSSCATSVTSAWDSLDSRIKKKVGSCYDVSKITDIKTRLNNISAFLGILITTYQSADLDLKGSLSVEQLTAIYPGFNSLSDERKAILIAALRYLGMNGAQVLQYGQNFSSQFARQQFRGDSVNSAWCAMFVGSMISYFFGDSAGGIINPSFASVYKIIGTYNNQQGIAFNPDDRVHYYVSQAAINYGKSNNMFSNWQGYLNSYNSQHGTNLSVNDWVNEGFVPIGGDIIVFNGNNKGGANNYYPNSTSALTHIGFVLGTRTVNGVTYIDTVEGNVSNDVQVRSFRADDPYIIGYGHIDYERFYSDQTAVQKTISEGIDVRASGATVGLLTRKLLDFNGTASPESKQAYLVNLANNVDNLTGATVGTTHVPATQTEQPAVVQTSKPTDTNTQTTPITTTTTTTRTSNNNYNSYSSPRTTNNYSYSSTNVSSDTVTQDKTDQKIVVTTKTEETKVEETPITVTEETSDNKYSFTSLLSSKEKILEELKNKSVNNVSSPQVEETDTTMIDSETGKTIEETISENKDEVPVTEVKEEVVPVEKDEPVVETSDVKEEPTVVETPTEPVVTVEPTPVEVTSVPTSEVTMIPTVEVTPVPTLDEGRESPTELPEPQGPSSNYDNDYEVDEDYYDVPDNPEPVVDEPKKKGIDKSAILAGLGIATGGAAIVYTVNKYKKNRDGE